MIASRIPGLTPSLLASVREALSIRASALADLAACPESRRLTPWASDRRNDVRHTNDWIARQAELLVLTPEELIAAAVAAVAAE